MKLAVCTTHPIQYQAPVWRHLANQPDIELKVFFASDFSLRGYRDHQFNLDLKWDQPLSDGYDSVVLGSGIKGGFFSLNGRGLHSAFSKFQWEELEFNVRHSSKCQTQYLSTLYKMLCG